MDKLQDKLREVNKLSSQFLQSITDGSFMSSEYLSGGGVVLDQTIQLLQQFGSLINTSSSSRGQGSPKIVMEKKVVKTIQFILSMQYCFFVYVCVRVCVCVNREG